MNKNMNTISKDHDLGDCRSEQNMPALSARFAAWRLCVAVVLLLGWAAATWLTTTCAGADQKAPGRAQERRRPRAPAEPPPVPTNAPLPIRWEAGPWWAGQHGDHASVCITNADAHSVILGPTVTSTPAYLTLQRLELGAPASDPLTLMLVKVGPEHPLHVLDTCTIHPNAGIRIDNAALQIDGPAIVGGRLNLGRGSVRANSGLVVGESPTAAAVVTVTGGTLTATNANHSARITVGANGKGTLSLNGGTVQADSLEITTDPDSRFIFKDGTAKLQSVSAANHAPITIGDGVHPATLELRGGTNRFSAPLTISANATLLGSGTICGPVVNYGTIQAGRAGDNLTFASAGSCVSSVTNWGRMYMTNGGKLSFQGTAENKAVFPITMPDQAGAGFTLQFVSVGGLRHALQSMSAVGDAEWKTVDSAMGTGETLSLTERTPAAQTRYYRIYVGR
jgi:hypothetical protein